MRRVISDAHEGKHVVLKFWIVCHSGTPLRKSPSSSQRPRCADPLTVSAKITNSAMAQDNRCLLIGQPPRPAVLVTAESEVVQRAATATGAPHENEALLLVTGVH